jgi:hypothetical protein
VAFAFTAYVDADWFGNGYPQTLTWSGQGGALKERYLYMTTEKVKEKRKAIVTIARRPGEPMYTLLKKGTGYGVRHFKREEDVAALARLALSA